MSNHIFLKDLARHSGTNECNLKRGFKYFQNNCLSVFAKEADETCKAITAVNKIKGKGDCDVVWV